MSREIALTKGYKTVVDDADYEELSKYRWHALITNGGGHVCAVRSVYRPGMNPTLVLMHRQLTGAERGQEVDHINGDPLDNRRANLRTCTRHQNAKNRRSRAGASGYKGVHQRESGKFRAKISADGRVVMLGNFDTAIEAALAYDNAARRLHGEFAAVNGV